MKNNITENDYGLFLEGRGNVILENNVTNSYYWGMNLNSNNNTIYLNNFSDNPIHVIDDGLNNEWNSIDIGNYWDTYTGIDINDDGIGDTPHVIKLSPLIQDKYPIWWDGDDLPPVIIINSPLSNQLVGRTTPNFNVRIIDPNLDRIWYTLNGGLTNTTFLTNESIDQALWDSLGSGNIKIEFYANDTIGKIGYASVTVEKDIDAPIIQINTPVSNQQIGRTAPDFSTTIIEANLDTIWYTIDGGINNLTFTGTAGTINQALWETLWDTLSHGDVITISFYANDTLGHLGDNDVEVIKTDDTPPDDDGVLEDIPGYDIILIIGIVTMVSLLIIKFGNKRVKFAK